MPGLRTTRRPACSVTYALVGPSGGIRMVMRRITTDDGARAPPRRQASWIRCGDRTSRDATARCVPQDRRGLVGGHFAREVPVTVEGDTRWVLVGVCRCRPAALFPAGLVVCSAAVTVG